MSRMYNYLFDDGQYWRVSLTEIENIRDEWLIRLPEIKKFSDRISNCFWLDILILKNRYDIWPGDVLQPLLDIENGEPVTGIKQATRFTREPLRGLWHKHWYSPRFLAANLLAAMSRKDSMDFIWDIAKEGDPLTDDIIKQISHHFTVKSFEERSASKKMTGEWIIFIKYKEINYYLCLATHETGDQRIFKKITSMCSVDFPELPIWLADVKR